jgi:Ca2+-binding EF-hand superfamily protein
MISSACLLLIATLGADGPAASVPARAGAAPTSRTAVATAAGFNSKISPADRRDIVLLLDDGPLHLRLHLSLEGISLGQARQQYVAKLIDRLDANHDGKLSREEASRSPLLRTKSRPGADKFLEGLGKQIVMSARDVEQAIQRIGGEPVAYRQDLTSSQNDLEVFKLLDADKSGLLEGVELTSAAELLYAKDGDYDECVSFEEFFPPPPPPDPALAMVVPPPPTTATPLATVADMVRDTQEPLLSRRLIKKYDKNRDVMLDAAELHWPAARVRDCDADGNGKLDLDELSKLGAETPDVEMVVDLKGKDAEGGLIGVKGSRGKRIDEADRLDYAKMQFELAVLTFSHRNLDPVASAIETAMRQFNALDVDANGYLDRDETALRIRFERGLFELMDMDGDEKLFADEMKQYVQARAEPAATTCRVNVYDTGYGFFMALDANADGRVSVREMRHAPSSLNQLDRDGQAGVSEKEPVRHFHIEFVRGSYQLFGPSEQLVAQTPAFQQRRPTGPIWFQRMDRNNDGDLTWNEFLGPREVFHKLDSDQDGMIDPQEAAKAK